MRDIKYFTCNSSPYTYWKSYDYGIGEMPQVGYGQGQPGAGIPPGYGKLMLRAFGSKLTALLFCVQIIYGAMFHSYQETMAVCQTTMGMELPILTLAIPVVSLHRLQFHTIVIVITISCRNSTTTIITCHP
jgi:hypothetical protein